MVSWPEKAELQPQVKVNAHEKKKANWVVHILCRNITEWQKEGRIEVIGRQDINSYMKNL